MSRRRSHAPSRGVLELALDQPPRPGLWPLAQFGRVATLWLVAFILLAVATIGSRNDADPTNAGLWILLGLLGGVLAGAGSTFWLVAGTRSVRARQQVVTRRIVALTPDLERLLGVSAEEVEVDQDEAGAELVRVDQGTLYHRADCLLVAGKTRVPVLHVDPSLTPCGVCQP